MTARSASSRSSTTAPSSGSPTRSSTTTRPTRTSRRSSAASSAALEARGLTLQGITTDGSALYPEPIAAVFGDVPHQVCTFHVLSEVTKAVLSAVAQVRKGLAAGAPKLPRGRPGLEGGAGVPPGARSGSSGRSATCSSTATCSCGGSSRASERATLAADHPRPAATPQPARADGGGLPAVRPAVPDGHGVGQAGAACGRGCGGSAGCGRC